MAKATKIRVRLKAYDHVNLDLSAEKSSPQRRTPAPQLSVQFRSQRKNKCSPFLERFTNIKIPVNNSKSEHIKESSILKTTAKKQSIH